MAKQPKQNKIVILFGGDGTFKVKILDGSEARMQVLRSDLAKIPRAVKAEWKKYDRDKRLGRASAARNSKETVTIDDTQLVKDLADG